MSICDEIKGVESRATCLHDLTAVEAALDKMAAEMRQQLADKNPLLLCVMIGGVIPVGNLLPRLDFPVELHYVHASRYNSSTTGGELIWKAEPGFDLKDRTVVVVDDILDKGLTLAAIMNYCREQGAGDVYSAALVDKLTQRDPGGIETADFVGLTVEDVYVYGYGLDYKEYLRNAPGIYAVAEVDQ